MNKETKEKEIKEFHELVLSQLYDRRNRKQILKKIYFCKDNKIRDEIEKILLWRKDRFSDDVIDKYIKKLSKNKKMQKEIKEVIIKIVLGTDKEFKENEKVINYIEQGELDDEIEKLLKNQYKYFNVFYNFLSTDFFKKFYEKNIYDSSSINLDEYKKKVKNEKEFYILLLDALNKRTEIIEKEKLKEENEGYRNLTIKSKELAEEYKITSIKCFKYAFAWFLLCWFIPILFDWLRYMCDWQYHLPQDYFGEIFIFLSKLLFKLPSFVLCLVGVKFLYLFVHYKTEEREFLMLDSYLEKLPQDCTKERAELVKQLAPHFFPDKKATKISQGFLQDLLLKIVDKDKH